MNRFALSLGFLVMSVACTSQPGDGSGGGGGTASGSGGGDTAAGGGIALGGGTASSGGGSGSGDLPCAASVVLEGDCQACHGAVLAGGAPMHLVTLADLTATSAVDSSASVGQRCVIRMRASTAGMPPAPQAPVAEAQIDAFATWVTAGMPAGTCSSTATGGGSGGGGASGGGNGDGGSGGGDDAGVAPDAGVGPFPTTCTSNSFWSQGNHGSSDMNPGLACKTCHLTNSFFNDDQFMGTVFPSEHEKDLCNAQPPSGTVVQIVDSTGAVALTLTVSGTSGNFHSAFLTSVSMPYTARVVANGATASMTTPQTSGDCNSCHTEQGTNGAPGRIALPP
jgi:hypothetical protein